MDFDTTTTRRREAYQRCLEELGHTDPDFRAAQVYATLSVEEALRDLMAQLTRMTDRLIAGLG